MNDSYALFGLRFYFIKQGFFRIDYTFDNESWVSQTFHQKRLQVKGEIQLYKWLYLRGGYSYGDSIYYDPVNPYMGKKCATNFLASFTLIPGTVVHAGYESIYEERDWETVNSRPLDHNKMIQTRQSFFVKASYLWRL